MNLKTSEIFNSSVRSNFVPNYYWITTHSSQFAPAPPPQGQVKAIPTQIWEQGFEVRGCNVWTFTSIDLGWNTDGAGLYTKRIIVFGATALGFS